MILINTFFIILYVYNFIIHIIYFSKLCIQNSIYLLIFSIQYIILENDDFSFRLKRLIFNHPIERGTPSKPSPSGSISQEK